MAVTLVKIEHENFYVKSELCEIDFKEEPLDFNSNHVTINQKREADSDKVLRCEKELNLNLRPFQCDLCDARFSLRGQLNRHKRCVHQKKTIPCVICRKEFTDKSYLNNHIRIIHNSERNFQCQFCKKTFRKKSNLKTHIESIHENKRFNCDLCKKEFTFRTSLNNHIKTIHSQDRNFKCQECPKTFKENGHLLKHIQAVHFKLKPFQCHYCKKKTATSYNMRQHMKVHSKEGNQSFKKGIHCILCGHYFSKKFIHDHFLNFHVELKCSVQLHKLTIK